jgi:hypothetical protein
MVQTTEEEKMRIARSSAITAVFLRTLNCYYISENNGSDLFYDPTTKQKFKIKKQLVSKQNIMDRLEKIRGTK